MLFFSIGLFLGHTKTVAWAGLEIILKMGMPRGQRRRLHLLVNRTGVEHE
jgi:hypothetical protein